MLWKQLFNSQKKCYMWYQNITTNHWQEKANLYSDSWLFSLLTLIDTFLQSFSNICIMNYPSMNPYGAWNNLACKPLHDMGFTRCTCFPLSLNSFTASCTTISKSILAWPISNVAASKKRKEDHFLQSQAHSLNPQGKIENKTLSKTISIKIHRIT